MADNFDDYMRTTITRNFFKAAVGRQMFCPICQTILDYRRAVLFNDHVICATCYGTTREKVAAQKGADYVEALERDMARELNFIDGRNFAKGKK